MKEFKKFLNTHFKWGTWAFSGIGVFALTALISVFNDKYTEYRNQKKAETEQNNLLQESSDRSLKIEDLNDVVGSSNDEAIYIINSSDIEDGFFTENNDQRKAADNTSETDAALILGRFSKDEWENLKWQADSISLTGNDECYDITFEEETPNPQIYVYESRSDGYLNIPLLYHYFSSPNIVWMLTVCDEEGNQFAKYGIIGQMEDKQRFISNVPISVGNTYLIFDLIDENYISELLQFQLNYSLGQFKMEEGT